MTALIRLHGVSVHFGALEALRDVDLEVRPGDLLVVVGPDGAGKSTLARVLVGLQSPSAGRVEREIAGNDVGYAGADFDLYEDLTVWENLAFFAGMRGLGAKRAAEAGERLLRLTGLEEARDRLAGRLSGGMKKKLSLAGALIHEPPLMVLDEPTAGVDPVSRRELWDVVAEANAGGTAVVYTSPYLDEAARARRVTIMHGGRLEEVEPERLLDDPEGVRAWVVPVELPRPELRGRIAAAERGVRVYLRQEGLTVLAAGAEEARDVAGLVVGGPVGEPRSVELDLDDAFVLMEERWEP